MTPIPDRDYDPDLDHDLDLDLTPTIPAQQDTPLHMTEDRVFPPVTSRPSPPIDQQICELGFKLGEVLEDEYTDYPTTTILIDASQEEGATILTTPRQQRVPCTTPTASYEPACPPPKFHMGTPERGRAHSAPTARAKSSLRSRDDHSERPSRKVRIADIGDGFEQPGDRLAVPVDDDPYDTGDDSMSKN